MAESLYTAIATSTGDGRAGGRAVTDDNLLDVTLAIPRSMGGFSLSAALHVELGGVDQQAADNLIAAAHAVCPYSNATRGNIPVTIDATVA